MKTWFQVHQRILNWNNVIITYKTHNIQKKDSNNFYNYILYEQKGISEFNGNKFN